MGTENNEILEYDADQIQILEGLEAVRKRPGMYIGSTSVRGLHHLVYEIVDNAVDEALAGFCNEIYVSINEDNSITVIDNGRGIPVGINHKAGIPAVEVVFTILHAGGKFGGGGYKVAGGLHGVGASVVNALSEWLEVTIYHEGQVYRQRYERGKTIYSLKVVDTCEPDKTGTMVRFQADPEVFEEINYDFATLKQRLREMAFLTKGLRICLEDKREGLEQKKSFRISVIAYLCVLAAAYLLPETRSFFILFLIFGAVALSSMRTGDKRSMAGDWKDEYSPKSRIAALVLCIFLGGFGIHNFYVGKIGWGILYLFTFGLFGIGWLIDIIRIACGNFRDSQGRYLKV